MHQQNNWRSFLPLCASWLQQSQAWRTFSDAEMKVGAKPENVCKNLKKSPARFPTFCLFALFLIGLMTFAHFWRGRRGRSRGVNILLKFSGLGLDRVWRLFHKGWILKSLVTFSHFWKGIGGVWMEVERALEGGIRGRGLNVLLKFQLPLTLMVGDIYNWVKRQKSKFQVWHPLRLFSRLIQGIWWKN